MRKLSILTATAVLITTLAAPVLATGFVFPVRPEEGFPQSEPPRVTASSWIIYDELTDTVLGSWDADTRRPPASITKIMTVLVAVENGDLDEMVTISEEAAGTGGQEIGLVVGEQVTLGALVRAALIRSGNDAATAIAEHIGGSVEGFAAMMNAKAAELGMANSNFITPHGLDTNGHYSSARDMLLVGVAAMNHPELADIARSRVLVFPDTPNGSARSATNTNRILNSYDGVVGIKTGETPRAGLTYVGAAERNGRRLYVVVFKSVGRRAHFADAIALWNWAFNSLGIHASIGGGIPYQPIADRVTPSPLLEEAAIETYLAATTSGVTAEPPTPPGLITPPPPEQPSLVTRRPSNAPSSVMATLRYWIGLATGEFDG